MKKVNIIEPICYLYPHKDEIVASHPSMIGTWKVSRDLLKEKENSFFAPLLVDDIKREGMICYQSVCDILKITLNKKYQDFNWIGKQISEGDIQHQYGNLGCKVFDSIYHWNVINSLYISQLDWSWTLVNPISFKKQQSGMILDLWNRMSKNISFESIGNVFKEESFSLRKKCKDEFLNRFTHYWIDENGQIEDITKPVYSSKKIVHKSI